MISDVGTTERKVSRRDRLRIFERDKGTCRNCGKLIRPGDRWTLEHLRALELGGSNEDDNLGVFCDPCAAVKTPEDHRMAAKAKRTKAASLGIRKPSSLKSQGFVKPPPQRRATRPVERISRGMPALQRRFTNG